MKNEHVLAPLGWKAWEILRVSWTAKKTNESVLNKAGIKRELLDRQSKEASILWSHHEETRSCLKKEIMQGTMPGARRRRRPRTAWMDNIKTWIGLPVEESIRITEDRDKWRKYVHHVHGVANPRIEDCWRTEQNRLTSSNFAWRVRAQCTVCYRPRCYDHYIVTRNFGGSCFSR